MFLRSVRIRHFKSIDDAQVGLCAAATLLVGPNAVGKSNIVDSLRFVRDAVSVDLDHAVSNRGGMARVRQLSRTKPYAVWIKLEFSDDAAPDDEPPAPIYYEFQLKSQLGGNYSIESEKAQWYETQRESTTRSERRSLRRFHRLASGEVASETGTILYRVLPDQLALGRGLLPSSGWPLARFIRDWRFSAIYPNLLRQPASPDKDKLLAEDGGNWASVIKALRRSAAGRGGLERLYEAMRAIVPGFVEVNVAAVGNYLVPRFRFAATGSDVVEFDASQLSDGTLRVFGILLALYQTPAPRLLIIEEPEQTVHPGVLGVLADAVREAGEQTQIILTTHSPNFVDHFLPEEVRVVSLTHGLTRVALVKRTQVEAVKRRLMALSDFMEAEGLQSEPA